MPGIDGKKNNEQVPEPSKQTEQEKTMIRTRYEELRRDVLRSDSGTFVHNRGLALLLRHGMLGWVDAWLQCRILNKQSETGHDDNVRQELPRDVRGQLVLLMANMAMQTREEVRVPC